MKEVAARKLLDSLADVTAERDQARFRTSLSHTVRELLAVDDLLFMRAHHDADGSLSLRDVRHGALFEAERPPPPVLPEQLARLAQGEHLLDAGAGGATLMLPVRCRDVLVEIVVVRAPSITPEVLYLLRGFTRLYRNFLALIMESERDPLTGLFNRRTLETRLADLARDGARRAGQVARDPERRVATASAMHYVAMIDLDHFKRINDTLGHLFGDEVLLLVSRLMRESFRDEDLLFRYGGEELVVVLAAPAREQGRAALERFRAQVSAHRFPQLPKVTISIGFTEMRTRELPTAAIARADQALYCAKQDGRDCVRDYDELRAAGRIGAESSGHGAELF